ncbi:MAG TPA: hypothetical protein VNX18_05115 [Bryobacteraceae bacterium]|jgi:hypothetical protein|nr:hypothetical protein [Bryobacteraceae bacterium]
MDERMFELYRLSVVQSMPDSKLKTALIQAIRHKLKILDPKQPDEMEQPVRSARAS